jgi:hypothetical protein
MMALRGLRTDAQAPHGPGGRGLGLLRNLIVDQHFEQRTRLGRLLAVVSQSPQLVGLGLDEDTAAIVYGDPDHGDHRTGRGRPSWTGPAWFTDAFQTKGHRPMMVSGAILHSLRPGTGSTCGPGTLIPSSIGEPRRLRRRETAAERLPSALPGRPHWRAPTPSTWSGDDVRNGRPRSDRRPDGKRSRTGTREDRSRARQEPASEEGPPPPPTSASSRRRSSGPNYWSYEPAIRLLVDLGSLEDWPSNTLEGFTEALLEMLPAPGTFVLAGPARGLRGAAEGRHVGGPRGGARGPPAPA